MPSEINLDPYSFYTYDLSEKYKFLTIVNNSSGIQKNGLLNESAVEYESVDISDFLKSCTPPYIDNFDGILIDSTVDEFHSNEIISHLRTMNFDAPIIVMSTISSVDLLVRSLNLGADEFIGPEISDREFYARLNSTVARCNRHKKLTETELRVTCLGEAFLDHRRRRLISYSGADALLSSKEFDVMDVLSTKRGKVVARREIYKFLYGYENSIDNAIINVYISKIRKKLRAIEVFSLEIQAAWGSGYRLI